MRQLEWAFGGPAKLTERFGHLDAKKIGAMDVDEFVAVCSEKPSIHRFPGSMGKRIHQVCSGCPLGMPVRDARPDARLGLRALESVRGLSWSLGF